MPRVRARPVSWLDRFRIRQCVGSGSLTCGCETGRYLSYADELIEIIERPATGCGNPLHAVDVVVTPAAESATRPHV